MSPEKIIHHMCQLQHESERIKDHFSSFIDALLHDIKAKFEDIITFSDVIPLLKGRVYQKCS